MSNKVGELYGLIIDQVIKETKADLEESGDDPAVPELLREAWKKRLKAMKVSKEPLWNDMPHTSTGPRSSIAPQNLAGPLRNPASMPGIRSDVLSGSATNNSNLGGLNNISIPSDPLALYGLSHAKDLDSGISTLAPEAIGDQSNRNQQFVKQQLGEPTSVINNNSVPTSSANYNPLESSKPMEKQESEIRLSPQLQAQFANAMNGTQPKVPQTDGPQDEELNSDLDDSEDELNSNDEEDDGDQTQIMLCLYEKVHKVKTRWKYTLKDGVANVNGLDYVFAKATGESEW